MPEINLAILKVLVVDHSAHMVAIQRDLLRRLGIKSVVEAGDAETAWAALAREEFDVILVEQELTPIDGIALVSRLRRDAEQANRNKPVIMLTAGTDSTRILKARDAGVSEFIKKPISAQVLSSRIMQAVRNPRPFVEAAAYTGPDRRRRALDVPADHDRRRQTSKAAESGE
ncbi:response regulator [Cucumibacter marinus]|uniref:response regulator n=1 Tax=Cucumibacter marinus TaxID=1121252 RepID=UPI0004018C40|nr:response regulator [Cucumibacter marinus]